MKKKRTKKTVEIVDGLSAKNIEQIRKAIRQVWSWSTPRRLCLKRATDQKGFGRCELCKMKVAKLFVDHIVSVGEVDGGFIKRLFCSSKGLQAICKICHGKKTRDERRALKYERDAEKGFL